MSNECKDFIYKCLKKNPNDRLGSKNGVEDIIGHPWFKGLDRDKFLKKQAHMPKDYLPELSDDALDLRYFANEFTDLPKRESVMQEKTKEFIKKHANLFKDFDTV